MSMEWTNVSWLSGWMSSLPMRCLCSCMPRTKSSAYFARPSVTKKLFITLRLWGLFGLPQRLARPLERDKVGRVIVTLAVRCLLRGISVKKIYDKVNPIREHKLLEGKLSRLVLALNFVIKFNKFQLAPWLVIISLLI